MGTGLEFLKEFAEGSKKIKFAPGVIGKSTMIWLEVVAAWIIVFWRLSGGGPWWLNVEILGGVVALTLAVMRETGRMRAYAKENPGPAMVEGAELTEYKRLEVAQAKGLPPGKESPLSAVANATTKAADQGFGAEEVEP